MICRRKNNGYGRKEWLCDFTEECDRYNNLFKEMLKLGEREFCTYLYDLERSDEYVYFRVPGTTVGKVLLEDMIIKEINFNEDAFRNGIFSPDVLNVVEKYIGKKLIIKEEL